MSNRVNKGLTPDQMLRVKACAIIATADKAIKRINTIANDKSIDVNQAAIVYVIGALKRAKKLGIARNYNDALDKLEAEQAGDRGCPLTRTLSVDKLSRTISRINRINKGLFTRNGITYRYNYDSVYYVGNDGSSITIPDVDVIDSNDKQERRIGKVFGTLYTEYEGRQKQFDPAVQLTGSYQSLLSLQAQYESRQIINRQIDNNLRLFFNEYVNHLSVHSRQRLYELVQDNTDPVMLSACKNDNKRYANYYNLYRNFPHKESVSYIDYINLIRQHITAPINA